jgi:hypothetical protein
MPIDWSRVYNKYRGFWVAFKSDEKTVVASAKTAKEAWEKAHKKGEKNPIMAKMPEQLITYVGSGWLS